MTHQNVAISLKRFLLIEQCPADWRKLDLYLFRDDTVFFYAGQSEFAFGRVWEHLKGGFHGHSIVGRFVWANWPASMNFTIELLSSQSDEFHAVENTLNSAEKSLIQRWTPCFNISLNSQPTPLPDGYFPPNARFRVRRSLTRLIYEAERAVKAEERRLWIKELE